MITFCKNDKVKSRVSKDVIIPYTELSFASNDMLIWPSISEIWAGPKCDARNEEFARRYIKFCDFGQYLKKFDCGYR